MVYPLAIFSYPLAIDEGEPALVSGPIAFVLVGRIVFVSEWATAILDC